jgi:hypothetical protein
MSFMTPHNNLRRLSSFMSFGTHTQAHVLHDSTQQQSSTFIFPHVKQLMTFIFGLSSSVFHLRSFVFGLSSSVFHLRSFIFGLPSSVFHLRSSHSSPMSSYSLFLVSVSPPYEVRLSCTKSNTKFIFKSIFFIVFLSPQCSFSCLVLYLMCCNMLQG